MKSLELRTQRKTRKQAQHMKVKSALLSLCGVEHKTASESFLCDENVCDKNDITK